MNSVEDEDKVAEKFHDLSQQPVEPSEVVDYPKMTDTEYIFDSNFKEKKEK